MWDFPANFFCGRFETRGPGMIPACRTCGTGYFASVKNIPDAPVGRIPASRDLIARAEACLREFGGCFWFRHPMARVRYLDDVTLVIRHLREYGDHKAWQAAQDLQKCL